MAGAHVRAGDEAADNCASTGVPSSAGSASSGTWAVPFANTCEEKQFNARIRVRAARQGIEKTAELL